MHAGGADAARNALTKAELYDPATNSWSAVGQMQVPRRDATATKLPNGKVLIEGGYTDANNNVTNTVDVFDPSNNSFSLGKPMSMPRALHAATVLANGDVFVTGGYVSQAGAIARETELYSVAADTWTPKALMATKRATHKAALLADGRVLVVGGGDGLVHLNTSEVYNPATGSWTTTGPMLRAHNSHAISALSNGKVLVSGGVNAAGIADQATELYDPATNAWSSAGTMIEPRTSFTSTLLPNGRVLLASGTAYPALPYTRSTELWTPTTSLLADPAVSFDDLAPGASGAAVAHVTNTGDSPLLPSGVALAGSFPRDYAITSDGCSGAVVVPGQSCAIGLRFTPGAGGARGATLTFTANTAALNHAVSLIGRGIAPVSGSSTPARTGLQTIVVTLAYRYSGANARSTRITGLTVKGVPAGSTVTARCKKGCHRKSLVKRNVGGNVRLTGLVTKKLKVGTVITVTVSKPGMISAIKTLTIRKRKPPEVTTRCLAPGQTKPAKC